MTDETWIADSSLGERFPAWTRGNAADVFPEPFSPLGKTMVLRAMADGLRDAYIELGVLDYDEYENPEAPDLFKIFGGYVYNPLTMTRIFGARMPGATPEAIDQAFFDERDEVPPYEEEPWHVSPKHEAKLGESAGWAMSATELPELDADKALAHSLRANRPDLESLTDSALVAYARSMMPYIQQTFENAMRVSTVSALGPGALGAICGELGDETLAIRLLAGIEVDSAAPSHAMWKLGRVAAASPAVSAEFDAGVEGLLGRLQANADAAPFIADFDRFLVEHGARAQNEYDPRSTSWEVRPDIALAAIDLMRRSDDDKSPEVRAQAAVAERDRITAEVRPKLADNAEAAGTFEAALGSAQLFLAGRERAKTNVVIVINELRMALRAFGARLVERGVIDEVDELFMLTNAELDEVRADPDSVKERIAARWAQYRSLFDREPVFIVNGAVPSLDDMGVRATGGSETVEAGAVLTGAAGSGGSASGRARVIRDAADPTAMEPGDVLIAPQTDPSWVPLFVPAAAVVVNVGALGSHAMIVSREFGIPCVVSVENATDTIPDGALVTVDGTTGTVTIDELPS